MIPLRTNTPVRRTPLANYGLVTVNFLVFLALNFFSTITPLFEHMCYIHYTLFAQDVNSSTAESLLALVRQHCYTKLRWIMRPPSGLRSMLSY